MDELDKYDKMDLGSFDEAQTHLFRMNFESSNPERI